MPNQTTAQPSEFTLPRLRLAIDPTSNLRLQLDHPSVTLHNDLQTVNLHLH